MTIAVMVNPSAGKGHAATLFAEVLAECQRRDLDVTPLGEDSVEDNERALLAALASGADRIVVVGGDGLVNLVVQHVAQTNVALGIIPAGTGNDFARALGIRNSASRGVAQLVDTALGDPVRLDLLRSPHGWAASVITQGFSVTTNRVANRLPWPPGGRRYVLATALALPALRSASIELQLDDATIEVESTILAIGNTRYFGSGTAICPDADPTDGLLDVVSIGPLSRRELVTFYDSVPDRSFLENPKVQVHRAQSVQISGGSTDLWADGEPLGPTPATVSCIAGALQAAVGDLG